jgi:hypothetical protein
LPDFLNANQLFHGHRAPSAPILLSETNLGEKLTERLQRSRRAPRVRRSPQAGPQLVLDDEQSERRLRGCRRGRLRRLDHAPRTDPAERGQWPHDRCRDLHRAEHSARSGRASGHRRAVSAREHSGPLDRAVQRRGGLERAHPAQEHGR